MKPFKMTLVFLTLLVANSAFAADEGITFKSPEDRLVTMLRAGAAACSISGQLAAAQLSQSPAVDEIRRAGSKADACVDEQLAEGKAEYRRALESAPASKSLLSTVYARWLRYMQTLRNPWDHDEHEQASAQFESVVADLAADLDAR